MKTKQILLCLLALFVSITVSARVFTYEDQWRLWDVSVIDESKKTVAIYYFHTNTNHSLSGETIKTPRTVTDPSTGEIYSVVAVYGNSFIAQDSEGDDVLFANASNARIIISEGVEEISESAFYCLNDISIVLPSTLTYIHKWAFYSYTGQNCTIYVPKGFSLNVPKPSGWTLKESDIVPFYDENVEALCVANWDTNGDGELSYTEAAAVTSLGNVFSNNTTITSFNELQYFTGLTEINDYAFSRSSLTSVIVPQNVTRIGKYAFARYSGDANALTTVKLPEGLTDIDEEAFSFCSQLKKLHLPQSLRNIGEAAFRGAGIESLVLPEGLSSIPYSMCNYALMKSLVIPSTVTSIGEAAFPVCTHLTSVVSAIEEPFAFGSNAFYNIGATCTLTVPVGTRDAYIAAGWTEEVFKGGIIEADAYVPVQNIDFADAIVKSLCVANWDTNEDGELSYTEAAAVTDLGYVFRQRKIESFDELQYFTGLTSIGQGAFERSSLTSVTIPGNITSIGYYAFSYCESLTSVVSEIEEPFTLNSSVFSSIASNCILTVPYGTRDAYIAAGWTENVFKGGVVEAPVQGTHTILDETSTTAPTSSDGEVDVLVRRAIKANEWSTICLPFAMTGTQVKSTFGEDVRLANFIGYEAKEDNDENVTGLTINFEEVNASAGMEANYPYLIKVSSEISEFEVKATIETNEEGAVVEYDNSESGSHGSLIGTYHAGDAIPANGLFLSGNQFWYSTGETRIKAFRAYFMFVDVLTEVEGASANIRYTIVDEATGIADVKSPMGASDGWYTLDGRRLERKPAERGVYIMDGKKVSIR